MIAGEVRSPENDEPALSFTKLDAEKSIGGRGRYRELDETDLDVGARVNQSKWVEIFLGNK